MKRNLIKEFIKFLKKVKAVIIIVCLVCGVYYGYTYYNEQKDLSAKYKAERYIVITEQDSLDNELRSFILDTETNQVIDIKDESDTRDLVVGINVAPKDYERLYAGKITDEEMREYKFHIQCALHDDEVEYCHITVDKDGNTIDHYHIKNNEVVTPTEKCEDCFTLIKYS